MGICYTLLFVAFFDIFDLRYKVEGIHNPNVIVNQLRNQRWDCGSKSNELTNRYLDVCYGKMPYETMVKEMAEIKAQIQTLNAIDSA